MGKNEAVLKKEAEQTEQMAAICHELKTPLSVSLAILDLMKHKMCQQTGLDLEEIDTLLGIAKNNIYTAVRIANNFLDTSRLERNVMTLRFFHEDVTRMLRQTEHSLVSMLKSRDACISFVCKTQMPFYIECDAQALERILLNLISNAIKHLPKQNGRILLTLEQERTQDEQDILRISVTDNGSGIRAEAVPYLFQKYWHDESENSVDKTGIGLGLYLAKALAEGHGGTIEVQSEPYIATTFAVTLPVCRQAQESDGVLRSNTAVYDTDAYDRMLQQELSDFL